MAFDLVPAETQALRFLSEQRDGWASYRRLAQAGVSRQTLGSLAFQDFTAERDDGWRITPTGVLAIAGSLKAEGKDGNDG